MPLIEQVFHVRAPRERVFDLSRSIDLHVRTAEGTGERAIAGRTTGLIELGEEVTWSARHFGVRQRLTARITQFDRPSHFRDTMVRGAFARFDHDHVFEERDDGCCMIDRFDFDAPLGLLGGIAERLFLTRYMERFLGRRAEILGNIAESDEWRLYLDRSHDC